MGFILLVLANAQLVQPNTSLPMDGDNGEREYTQKKVVLVGDGTVGKTSLAVRFTEDDFSKR